MTIEFGNILWKLRNDRHLTQAQLAKRIGLSASMIALYETGERLPSLPSLIDIARVFGVSTDFLLGIDRFREELLDVSGLRPEQIKAVSTVVDQYRALQSALAKADPVDGAGSG